jgi:hypothetical protein
MAQRTVPSIAATRSGGFAQCAQAAWQKDSSSFRDLLLCMQ